MANVADFDFTTGATYLPDFGELSYNEVTFSSLYATRLRSRAVKDNAGWTIKYVEYVLEAKGFVTIPLGATDIQAAMTILRERLDQPGGVLQYSGRGFGDFNVNAPGGAIQDVAWGPMPETLEFQPLGTGRGAYITWRCTIRISEYALEKATTLISLPTSTIEGLLAGDPISPGGFGPVLQFNFETSFDYDEENYFQLSVRGTLEIPLTRKAVDDATISGSVDAFRQRFMEQICGAIDQRRYRISSRRFPVSRDRRTMEFEVVANEIPPMGDPPGACNARGRFTVKPIHRGNKTGSLKGFVQWVCSLSITYTIRRDKERRLAYLAFCYMVWWRMRYSALGFFKEPGVGGPEIEFPIVKPAKPAQPFNAGAFYDDFTKFYRDLSKSAKTTFPDGSSPTKAQAMLIDFGLDEGMHRDSKTITFEASWLLLTTFPFLLQSCGVWRADKNAVGGMVWAMSMADVTGYRNWFLHRFRPSQDIIVDLRST